jgi:hypothetical protein
MSIDAGHIAPDLLLQDWLGETDAATREAVDAHLMACDACGELLDGLLALGAGVRGAVRAGTVAVVTGPAFVDGLAARGVRVREYRVQHNGTVNCTVAPDDEMLVSRLQAPLVGVQRLDMTMEVSFAPGVLHRWADIPFDAATGEVLFLPGVANVRTLPAHTMQLALLAPDEAGTREIGRYVFHHTPWSESTGSPPARG